ncbi:MAG: hypothetical protein GQ574_00500 [Crocinitomix sp.]|nr:hypothetical protein [Crocinitomix sp.]
MKSLILLVLLSCTAHSFAQITMRQSRDLDKAEVFFYLKKYRKALYHYQTVANDTNRHYAINQVAAIHAIIDSNKNFYREQHLKEVTALADSTFEIGSYLSAQFLYKQVLYYSPSLSQPKDRIIEIDHILAAQPDTLSSKEKEIARFFKNVVNKATSTFHKKEYNRSYDLFERTLGIAPDNYYARQMLKIIDDITSEIK